MIIVTTISNAACTFTFSMCFRHLAMLCVLQPERELEGGASGGPRAMPWNPLIFQNLQLHHLPVRTLKLRDLSHYQLLAHPILKILPSSLGGLQQHRNLGVITAGSAPTVYM